MKTCILNALEVNISTIISTVIGRGERLCLFNGRGVTVISDTGMGSNSAAIEDGAAVIEITDITGVIASNSRVLKLGAVTSKSSIGMDQCFGSFL